MIIGTRTVGRGRVLLLNGSGFWRWGFLPYGFGGEADVYNALVSNSAAWLLAAGEGEPFSVETDRRVYRSGEKVIVEARLRDESNQPLPGAQIGAEIYRTSPDSAEAETLDIVLEDRGGGLYTYELPAMGVGNWRIIANATLEGQGMGSAFATFLVEPYSLELERVGLNESALRNLAEASGGRYFHISGADSLPDLVKSDEVMRRRERERPIWDHPILLALFVIALALEWYFRKRWDLP